MQLKIKIKLAKISKMISNQSAVKKNSYMMANGTAGLNSAMTALMVPNSHKRRSGYKLSLMSGTNKQQQLGPPN